MYVFQPIGTNRPTYDQRMPLWHVVNGDAWSFEMRVFVEPSKPTPATPSNSLVTFALSEDRFSKKPYWTGTWRAGIEPVGTDGLIKISVPATVSAELNRGSYSFSVTVSDPLGIDMRTVATGTLLVEYEPTSPNHTIPYRKYFSGDEYEREHRPKRYLSDL